MFLGQKKNPLHFINFTTTETTSNSVLAQQFLPQGESLFSSLCSCSIKLLSLNSQCLNMSSCMRCGGKAHSLPAVSSKPHNRHQPPERDTDNIYAA